jgi:hypothetical protein
LLLGIIRIEYYQKLRRFRFDHLRAMVFDQMLPRISHYWPEDEVRRMMERAGLEKIRLLWVNGVSWSAIGTRPTQEESLSTGPA